MVPSQRKPHDGKGQRVKDTLNRDTAKNSPGVQEGELGHAQTCRRRHRQPNMCYLAYFGGVWQMFFNAGITSSTIELNLRGTL